MNWRGVVVLVLSSWLGVASAAPVNYSFRGLNVTRVNGETHLRGTSPGGFDAAGVTVGAQTVASFGTVALPFKVVEFAASSPIAATAAAAAVTAVKLNPAGLITSAVASYLLTKGIEYANGQLTKTETLQGTETATYYCYGPGGSTYCHRTLQAGCTGFETQWPAGYGPFIARPDNEAWPGRFCEFMGPSKPYAGYGQALNIMQSCYTPEGGPVVYPNNGACTAQSVGRPLVDSDWDAARVGYWPDAATRELIRNGVPLPTDKTVFNPVSSDVPVGDPYVDPVTGKRYQDIARVTPSPSTPEVADVQMVKQQVDSTGAPVVDSGTGQPVPPEEETDWCKKNPDASGCKPLDEVDDVELQQDTITLSISPVSGFGPDTGTCPADRTLFIKGGSPIVWSWGQYCTFAEGIRPLIVGFAWLSALMIVVGVARRNS